MSPTAAASLLPATPLPAAGAAVAPPGDGVLFESLFGAAAGDAAGLPPGGIAGAADSVLLPSRGAPAGSQDAGPSSASALDPAAAPVAVSAPDSALGLLASADRAAPLDLAEAPRFDPGAGPSPEAEAGAGPDSEAPNARPADVLARRGGPVGAAPLAPGRICPEAAGQTTELPPAPPALVGQAPDPAALEVPDSLAWSQPSPGAASVEGPLAKAPRPTPAGSSQGPAQLAVQASVPPPIAAAAEAASPASPAPPQADGGQVIAPLPVPPAPLRARPRPQGRSELARTEAAMVSAPLIAAAVEAVDAAELPEPMRAFEMSDPEPLPGSVRLDGVRNARVTVDLGDGEVVRGRIDVRNGEVEVQLHATEEAAGRAERRSGELKEALDEKGLKLARFNVESDEQGRRERRQRRQRNWESQDEAVGGFFNRRA